MSSRRRRMDPNRAANIARQVREGTYRVDLDRLADKLVDELDPRPEPEPPAEDEPKS